jgi:hypothetical protein
VATLLKIRILLLFSFWEKDLKQRILIKKCFMFTVGSVCHVKRFTAGSRNSLKDVRKPQMKSDRARKWLGQQKKYLYAADFDALVMPWKKCISVGGGAVYLPMSICAPFTYSPSCVEVE